MSNWMDDYDDAHSEETHEKGRTDLDRYWTQREAEFAEREAALREREAEALKHIHNAEARAAADTARWRNVQLEITPNMTGEDILRLYKKHGI